MSYYRKQYRYAVGKLFGHDVMVEIEARDDTEAEAEFSKVAAFFGKMTEGLAAGGRTK